MALFETLKHMALSNMDIVRYDTVDAVNMQGKVGKITMRTSPNIVNQVGGFSGKATHTPILFVVNMEQYQTVEKQLAVAKPDPVEEKARKWDELEKKIAKFYPELGDDPDADEEDEGGQLDSIGEVAAIAFGFM